LPGWKRHSAWKSDNFNRARAERRAQERMTRRPYRSPVGTDRWMISWADLLTLLFASLVVLYASASRNNAAALLKSAVDIPARQVGNLPRVNELAPPFERLNRSLGEEIAKGQVEVVLSAHGIVVTLKDRDYFESGSDEVQPVALESIGKVAAVIRDLPNDVRLEGHSDSLPIHNQKFRDNWSLSAARSAAVLTLLETRFEIPSRRLAIAGYADNQPVSENESTEGRARNRRVDIVILSGAK
jgi:chemotaxis protein MotB